MLVLLVVVVLLLYRRHKGTAQQLLENPDAHETQNKAFVNPQYGTTAARRRRIPSISELGQYNAKFENSKPAALESGGSGGGGGAGSASTLLFSVPMEVGGEEGGSTVNNMTLPRSRSGTVVAAARGSNYKIVSATDGIHVPDGYEEPLQRYAVAAQGGGGTAEYAEVGNQYASTLMMQNGPNMYNTLTPRSGAGHIQGSGARVNGGAASDADYATANPEYNEGAAGCTPDYATANPEYTASAAGDDNYATANPEYRVLDGEHGGTSDAAPQDNVYNLGPPGQKRGNAGMVAGKQEKGAPLQARCQRPAPGGGVCKNASMESSKYCKGHTCPECGEPKSNSANICSAHNYAELPQVNGGGHVLESESPPLPPSAITIVSVYGDANSDSSDDDLNV